MARDVGDKVFSFWDWDPAFEGAGQNEGVEKWLVQNSSAVPVSKKLYGKFFMGDSYVVLKSTALKDGSLSYDIHYWLGKDVSQDDASAAAMKALELDCALGGRALQFREVQGNETEKFLLYFKPFILPKPGKLNSGSNEVDSNEYEFVRRLYVCRVGNVVRIKEVPFSPSSLNHTDTFILDTKSKIFIYNGQDPSALQKAMVLEVLQYIKKIFHGGDCDVQVIDDHSEATEFWRIFGGFAPPSIKSPLENDKDEQMVFRLHCFNNGKLELVYEPLALELLDKKRCYLLDCGAELYMWMGRNTSLEERKSASETAEKLLADPTRSKSHVTRVIEGIETSLFKIRFSEWLTFVKLSISEEDPKSAGDAASKLEYQGDEESEVNYGSDDLENKLEDFPEKVPRSINIYKVSDSDYTAVSYGDEHTSQATAHEILQTSVNLEPAKLGAEANQLVDMAMRIAELEAERDRTAGKLMEAEMNLNLLRVSLQESQAAFRDQEKDLFNATKSLKEMTSERDSSNKKISELEADLAVLVGNSHKLDHGNLPGSGEAKIEYELQIVDLKKENLKLLKENDTLRCIFRDMKTELGEENELMIHHANESSTAVLAASPEKGFAAHRNSVDDAESHESHIADDMYWLLKETKGFRKMLRSCQKDKIILEEQLGVAYGRITVLQEQINARDEELLAARKTITTQEETKNDLASSLQTASVRIQQLEQKLKKEPSEKNLDHLERSHVVNQREWEDLVKTSQAAMEGAAMKVVELDGKLKASNAQRELLEQQLVMIKSNLENAEMELLQSKLTISELSTELEGCKTQMAASVSVLEEEKLSLEQQIQNKDMELAQARELIQTIDDQIRELSPFKASRMHS